MIITRGARITPGPSSTIERALKRLGTPAQVLSRHGHRVRGRMAFCPFHVNERTEALSLYRGHDGREHWKCHACGTHGDALDLEVMLTGRRVSDVIREWSR